MPITDITVDELLAEYAITRSDLIRDEIIKRHIPLARIIGQRYAKAFGERRCDIDDLIDWAMESLWRSVESFDESLVKIDRPIGKKFRLYASRKMSFYVVDMYRRNMHSRTGRELAKVYEIYLYDYFKEYGRYPNDEEIETHLNNLYDADNKEKAKSLMMKPTRENLAAALPMNRATKSIASWDLLDNKDFDNHVDGRILFDRIFKENRYLLDEFDWQVLYSLYVEELDLPKTAKKLNTCASVIMLARDRLLPRLRGAIFREQQELKEALA